MQSTASSTQELARDLAALAIALHKAGGADWLRLVGELELSISQLKGLLLLEREGEQALKDLAEELVLSLPAASRAVDGLHRRGLVRRWEDEEDRRQKRIAITADGSATLARLNEVRLAGVERFAETLAEEQRAALAGALAPLMERDDVRSCRP